MFGYKLVKDETDEDLMRQLIRMIEQTSKDLSIHIEALEKVGVVQESITKRLDHIEHFLDQLYGREDEEDRIIH
jgi:uncharacterized protein Yka (UPF0111/DUF47 family)